MFEFIWCVIGFILGVLVTNLVWVGIRKQVTQLEAALKTAIEMCGLHVWSLRAIKDFIQKSSNLNIEQTSMVFHMAKQSLDMAKSSNCLYCHEEMNGEDVAGLHRACMDEAHDRAYGNPNEHEKELLAVTWCKYHDCSAGECIDEWYQSDAWVREEMEENAKFIGPPAPPRPFIVSDDTDVQF